MSIFKVLGRNIAVVTLRYTSLADSSDKQIVELPIDLYEDKQLGSLTFKDTELNVDCDVNEAGNSNCDTYDIDIKIKFKKGSMSDCDLALVFKFLEFYQENFILMPSYFYGRAVRDSVYGLNSSNENATDSDKSEVSGSFAKIINSHTPEIAFFNPAKKNAVFMNFSGNLLEGIGELGYRRDINTKACEFILNIPLSRLKGSNSADRLSSVDKIDIKTRVAFSQCKDLGAFYNLYFDTTSNFHKDNILRSGHTMSQAVYKFLNNRSKYREEPEYSMTDMYSVLNGDIDQITRFSGRLESLIASVRFDGNSLREKEQEFMHNSGMYELKDIDAVYFICKSLIYLHNEDDRLIRENWRNETKDFRDRLVSFIDKDVLEYLDYKSSKNCNDNILCVSLCILPAAVTYLGIYMEDGSLIEKAQELAEKLFKMSFDCDSYLKSISDVRWSYMLMESFITLYEATGQNTWLDRSITAGSFFSTWHSAFEDELFKKYSGNALFRLFLYTLDLRYLRILKAGLDLHSKKFEKNTEFGVLAYFEVPGLYINAAEGLVAAIDNIDAKVLDRANGKLRVVVTNPTHSATSIQTYIDRNSDQRKPDNFFIPHFKEIKLAPGDTKVLTI